MLLFHVLTEWKFHRIRNKFGGIKEELLDLGYGSIEVVEEGFKFISIEDTRINQITEELAKSSVGTFAYYLWKIWWDTSI